MQSGKQAVKLMTPTRLVYRVGAGKAIGLLIGLLGFLFLPKFIAEPSWYFRIAVLLWYPTIGAVVGMMGVFARHPVLNLPLPWWLRGAIVGAWFNLLIALFAYQQVSVLMAAIMGEYQLFTSPFWLVLEGAIIGLLMDYLLTRWFGEGLGNMT